MSIKCKKYFSLSIQKDIKHEYSLEGLMLKLQYFGHHMLTTDSLEKSLMLGKIEGRRRRGRQRARLLDGITDLMDMSLSKLWVMVKDRKPGVLQSMGSQKAGMTEWLNSNIWNYQRSLVWIVLWIWFKTLLVAHDRHPILISHGFGRKNLLCSVTKPWKIAQVEAHLRITWIWIASHLFILDFFLIYFSMLFLFFTLKIIFS